MQRWCYHSTSRSLGIWRQHSSHMCFCQTSQQYPKGKCVSYMAEKAFNEKFLACEPRTCGSRTCQAFPDELCSTAYLSLMVPLNILVKVHLNNAGTIHLNIHVKHLNSMRREKCWPWSSLPFYHERLGSCTRQEVSVQLNQLCEHLPYTSIPN